MQRASVPLLVAALAACAREPAPTSALLITLDTTRADALGCYGNPTRGVSPHLDALALRGVVYESAHTVAPLTLAGAYLDADRARATAARDPQQRAVAPAAVGRSVEAIEPLQRYLALAPGRADEHYNLGVCLKDAGRTDEAIASFERALELEPARPAWLPGFLAYARQAGKEAEAAALEARYRAP